MVRASAVGDSLLASYCSMIADCPHLRSLVKDTRELVELYLQLPVSIKSFQNEKLKPTFRAGREGRDPGAVALLFGKVLFLLCLMLLVLLSSLVILKLGGR